MKSKFAVLFAVVLLFGIVCSIIEKPAHADSTVGESVEEYIYDNVYKALDGLDLSGLEAYYQSYGNKSFGATVREAIETLIDGQSLDGKVLIENLLDSLSLGLEEQLPLLCSILGLSLLSAMATAAVSGFQKEGTKNILRFVTYGATVSIVAATVGSAVLQIKDVLESLFSMSQVLFPILLTLTVCVGGASASAGLQPLLALGSGVVLGVMLKIVVPLFIAGFCFNVVGNLFSGIKLEKLNKTIGSLNNWVMGLTFAGFTFLLTLSGIIGSTSDVISIKTAKFALSSYVPVLGGYLSGGFDVVMAAGVLIKNSVGVIGLLLCFAMVIAPVIKIIALSITLKLCGALAEPIGDTNASKLLYSSGKSLNTLIAIVLGVTFVFAALILTVVASYNGGVL